MHFFKDLKGITDSFFDCRIQKSRLLTIKIKVFEQVSIDVQSYLYACMSYLFLNIFNILVAMYPYSYISVP